MKKIDPANTNAHTLFSPKIPLTADLLSNVQAVLRREERNNQK
jgi:hypothetical protein